MKGTIERQEFNKSLEPIRAQLKEMDTERFLNTARSIGVTKQMLKSFMKGAIPRDDNNILRIINHFYPGKMPVEMAEYFYFVEFMKVREKKTITKELRKCLKCRRDFMSRGKGNRLCDNCNEAALKTSPYAF